MGYPILGKKIIYGIQRTKEFKYQSISLTSMISNSNPRMNKLKVEKRKEKEKDQLIKEEQQISTKQPPMPS